MPAIADPSRPSVSLDGPMISLRDIRVSYTGREILHGITFDVQRGETLVILGGSGSGKSTLLRTLVGLEKPDSGELWIAGKNFSAISDAERDEIRKKIGMSFQGGALFGSMTVGENVALPLREHTKLEDSTIEIMVRLKLDQVGLSGYEQYMPSQLSGGMKKRAAVARARASVTASARAGRESACTGAAQMRRSAPPGPHMTAARLAAWLAGSPPSCAPR